MDNRKCIILLSGGLDSATTGVLARHNGFDLSAITFTYGQRHTIEVSFAQRVASFLGIKRHEIIDIPSNIFHSALVAGSGMEVPKNRDIDVECIPDTYVPARNILFLSYALALAESIGARDIFIGANAVDYSGYPDCRPVFFSAFQEMANLGTKAGISGDGFQIHTPLIDLKKSEIIRLGLSLGMDYSLTHSCYDPTDDGRSCGECDSCHIRIKGFRDAGVPDPTLYRWK